MNAVLKLPLEQQSHAGMPLTILSFGGGQDSTALLYMYAYDQAFRERYAPGQFLVVMADTGDEHPSTYIHVAKTKAFCREQGIEFHLVTSDMGYHAPGWQNLRHYYFTYEAIGSKAFPKTCSDRLKMSPLYKFLETRLNTELGTALTRKRVFTEFVRRRGRIQLLIGLSKGEEVRVADPAKDPAAWRRGSMDVRYPLMELGLDRAACQEYIRSVGHAPVYPSNCMLCPFMSLQELLWLYRNFPGDYAEWVDLEAAKLKKHADKGEKNLGVWGRRPLPEVLIEAQAKFGHLTDAELDAHKFSHGHCVKTKY